MSAMLRRLTWNASEQARLVASDDPILDCDQVVLTPLHTAAFEDSSGTAELLLNQGADVHAKTTMALRRCAMRRGMGLLRHSGSYAVTVAEGEIS